MAKLIVISGEERQEFELAASMKGIDLKCSIRPGLPLVNADIGLMERVLRNLIENALRYTGEGGTVAVSATPAPDGLLVEVADTGIGIPESELANIFERFYRVEKSRDLTAGGAGLGLAISKRILDLHGSTISAASAPGKTVFRFVLTYAHAQAHAVDRGSELAASDAVPSKRTVPSLTYPMAEPGA